MKKLSPLKINPEKLMKNEELITLRGGYGGACCWCMDENMMIQGAMAASDEGDCESSCAAVAGWDGWWDHSDPNCN